MQNTQKYVKIATATLAIAVLGAVQTVQAVELIIEQHEDLSITLKSLNGTELKGYANVNALAGPNGLADIINQMGEWIN